MNESHYIKLFQKAANQLDKKLLNDKQLEVAVGVYGDSVFLKLYKTRWANPCPDPLVSPSRIFFSIWINEEAIQQKRILYNIHALKLRQLKGYSIESRKFAAAFRAAFRDLEPEWPNISVAFGPLTLMQGWQAINAGSLQNEIVVLANRFLEMDQLIDKLLDNFKKESKK